MTSWQYNRDAHVCGLGACYVHTVDGGIQKYGYVLATLYYLATVPIHFVKTQDWNPIRLPHSRNPAECIAIGSGTSSVRTCYTLGCMYVSHRRHFETLQRGFFRGDSLRHLSGVHLWEKLGHSRRVGMNWFGPPSEMDKVRSLGVSSPVVINYMIYRRSNMICVVALGLPLLFYRASDLSTRFQATRDSALRTAPVPFETWRQGATQPNDDNAFKEYAWHHPGLAQTRKNR